MADVLLSGGWTYYALVVAVTGLTSRGLSQGILKLPEKGMRGGTKGRLNKDQPGQGRAYLVPPVSVAYFVGHPPAVGGDVIVDMTLKIWGNAGDASG